MLSIVICSINTDYLSNVTENIQSTIGTEFELLVWDNRNQNKGLCEVYNLMAVKAKFPYYCFLHEDVLFETQGWGQLLLDAFEENPETGLVGIAGSKYKSATYSGWHTGIPQFDCYNITHRINGVDHKMSAPLPGTLHQVVCVDGVLMACRKEVWEEVRFGEQRLKGFHFYDIDFSLRVAEKYRVVVVMNINLLHITQGGDYSNRWVTAAMSYHRETRLPRFVGTQIPDSSVTNPERRIAGLWLDRLKEERVTVGNKLKWIWSQRLFKWPQLWYPISKFLLYEPFGLKRLHRYFKKTSKTG